MKGKVVLVTGANGGLGTYVTQAFLDAGATVVGTSRKIQQSDFNNPNFTALPAEISTREGAQSLVDQVVARFGRLDVLAHTVGGFAGGQSIADTDDATFQEAKFSTWLIQIAINEAKMRLRKDRRHLYESIEEGPRSDDGEYMPKDYADWREI